MDHGGIVLIPSPLLSAEVWRPVADRLEELTTVIPELSADRERVGWRDHVRIVLAELDALETERVHLVAHSGAGVLVGPLVDARGDRVASLVLVDAMLPRSATSRYQLIAEEGDAELARRLRGHLDAGGLFPQWDDRQWQQLVDDPDLRQRLQAGFSPRAASYWDDVIETSDAWRRRPGLFVRCTETYRYYEEQARALGWRLASCDGGHLALVNRPAEIARLLATWCADIQAG